MEQEILFLYLYVYYKSQYSLPETQSDFEERLSR